ncbi:ATP synthase small subunit 6, mitochondrial [Linum perenne]
MRRLFDPWPVFFKREWNRNWPFLVGFAVTGTIITKMSLGLTGANSRPTIVSSGHLDCLLLQLIYIS